MAETWIANASPLIVLAKAGQLSILHQLCDSILVPFPVAEEILAGPAGDPARQALLDGWGTKVHPAFTPPGILEWDLGAGETSVLAVALERKPCTVLLDDAAARAAARTFGIPTLGTLGIIVRAKLRGRIPAAATAIREIKRAGLFLDDSVITEALGKIGETWVP